MKLQRLYPIAGVCLLALLLAACGPADFLPAPDLPAPPTGTVTPWRPVRVQTSAPARSLDRSLLTGDPCAPPCWYGLEASVTSVDEVRLFLDSSPLVQGWEVEPVANGDDVYRWQWSPPVPASASRPNAMRTRDGVLLSITLQPDVGVTLREVLDVLGAPAWVDLGGMSAAQPGDSAGLYYPDRGLLLIVGEAGDNLDGTSACPPPLAPVQTVVYLPAGTIETAVGALYDAAEAPSVLARLRTWDDAACLSLGE